MREARDLLQPRFGSRLQYLYLLNIHALVRANLGDLEGAMALELRIESACDALPERDARLDYVNAINMARLHHRLGQLDDASRRYARAFACTAGVRTERPGLRQRCAARLHAARGTAAAAAALSAWLRAALTGCRPARPRPSAGACCRRSSAAGRCLHTAFSTWPTRSDQLRAAADRAGAAVACRPADRRCLRVRAPTHSARARRSARPVGRHRGAVERATRGRRPGVRLAALTHGLLSAAAPELARATTLLVDDGLDADGRRRDELIGTCVRLHVPRAGQRRRIELGRSSGGDRGPIARGARRGRGVDRRGGRVRCRQARAVRFRRYRSPIG